MSREFQEGVEASFTGRREAHGTRREAGSYAFVFATAAEAQQELAASVAEDLTVYKRIAGRRQFTVPAIPGSAGFGNVAPRRRGASANVLFATGRCYAVVGNYVYDATTWSEGSRAPIAAAIALYKRAVQLCV